jgi:hypothetical protein
MKKQPKKNLAEMLAMQNEGADLDIAFEKLQIHITGESLTKTLSEDQTTGDKRPVDKTKKSGHEG